MAIYIKILSIHNKRKTRVITILTIIIINIIFYGYKGKYLRWKLIQRQNKNPKLSTER